MNYIRETTRNDPPIPSASQRQRARLFRG